MYLSKEEIIRVLEYIPQGTAPDLHEKFLGQLTSIRHYEVLYGLQRLPRRAASEEFVSGLTEREIQAWQKYSDSFRVDDEDES